MCHRRWHELIRAGRRGPHLSGRAVRRRAACSARQTMPNSAWQTGSPNSSRRRRLRSATLAATDPLGQDHPARHRRVLALSVRSGPRRCRAADPAAALRAGAASRRADRDDLARGARRRRRGRRDAAASPHEVGGGAADRAVRHRRGLAGDAGDGGADRSRGRLGADGAALSCCARKPRAAGCRRPITTGPRRAAA